MSRVCHDRSGADRELGAPVRDEGGGDGALHELDVVAQPHLPLRDDPHGSLSVDERPPPAFPEEDRRPYDPGVAAQASEGLRRVRRREPCHPQPLARRLHDVRPARHRRLRPSEQPQDDLDATARVAMLTMVSPVRFRDAPGSLGAARVRIRADAAIDHRTVEEDTSALADRAHVKRRLPRRLGCRIGATGHLLERTPAPHAGRALEERRLEQHGHDTEATEP